MNADVDGQLVDELNDLLVVKLAPVLVPARRVLQAIGREGLAVAMGKLTSSLSADLECILSGYNINRQAIHDKSQDI